MNDLTEWNAYNPMGVSDMLFGKDIPQEDFSQRKTSGINYHDSWVVFVSIW